MLNTFRCFFPDVIAQDEDGVRMLFAMKEQITQPFMIKAVLHYSHSHANVHAVSIMHLYT